MLNFSVPHLKSSSDYILTTIPYTPYAYTTATGNELTILYDDDEFSDILDLPYGFCFYDSLFSSFTVGSNGVITFDVSNSAPCNNSYLINSSPGLPASGGGGQCTRAGPYYPRSSICANFSDMDPSAIASPFDRKIEWRIEGTPRCRRAIISYYNVGVFGCVASYPNTLQIVLYESTGIIEIFTEQKSLCTSSTNQGRSLMGIQNWDWTKATPVPDRNPGQWTAFNEAHRFIPSGGSSRYLSSQVFTLTGTFVATADTTTTQAGMLDISFPNFCPPPGNSTYVIKTLFSSCPTGTILESSDTIQIVRANGLNATATTSPTACGPATGTITVDVPAGAGAPPFTFVLDGVITQTGLSPMAFNNVAGGNHIVTITDGTGCTSTINVLVGSSTTIFANLTNTLASCTGVNNGSVTITPTNGTAPFTFILDGGAPQTGPVPFTFSNLAPGTHNVLVRDNSGCVSNLLSINIAAGAGVSATAIALAPTCDGASNGTITVTTTTGQAPFQYSINTGPLQSSNVFNNLAPGTYNILVQDGAGCTRTFPVTVPFGESLLSGSVIIGSTVTCNGGNSGTVTVNGPVRGTAPFQYTINNITWQTSPILTGLSAGWYTVYVRDAAGCLDSADIQVVEPNPLVTGYTTVPAVCNGQNTGIIDITASGGISPYQFSLNGGAYQASGKFSGVGAGNHVVTIKDAIGCLKTHNVTVTQPAVLSLTGNTSTSTCDGGNNGFIIVNATGGNNGFAYSIDGNNYQLSDTFSVAPGNYMVTVRDNLNCIDTQSFVVGLISNLTHTPLTDTTICEGSSTTINFVSNATNYSWSPAIGLNNTGTSNPVANPTSTQQYIVSYTLDRCTEQDTILINVNTAPRPNAGNDGFICYGQVYQLQASGGVAYSWTPATFLDNANASNPTARPDNTVTYSLSIVADSNNCPSLISDQVTVDVTQPIKVRTYPQDTVVYPGDRFQLLATSAASNYSWSPGSDLDITTVNNPTITVNKDVMLVVTASSPAGCVGEATVRIRVFKGPDIYCPTGFTPNGDGLNDRFIPFSVGIQELKYFRIFNRWGQLVFTTTKMQDGWDGTMGGREQPAANYVWIAQGVTRDGKVITKKGSIVLIR